MSFDDAREAMVSDQLQRRGIIQARVLEAMGRVPRERFVERGQEDQAYEDRALAIECDQTISQPYIVGLMTQALALAGDEKLLEIGTGSGYQTAILAELAARVVSIERHAELSRRAAALLAELGYKNVRLVVGDGSAGWPDEAPYDRIIVTAAASQTPEPLFAQLRERGILVIPIGDRDSQTLQAIHKIDGHPRPTTLSGCRFVPLVGAFNMECKSLTLKDLSRRILRGWKPQLKKFSRGFPIFTALYSRTCSTT
jgi:protein-L-isoaspartate(D-aspartate) O-methyltransferase